MPSAAVGHCFFEPADAAAAQCGSLSGITPTHAVACEANAGAFRLKKTLLSDGSISYLEYVSPVAPACEMQDPFFLSLADGALLSSAIASVWLLAWATRAVISVLRGDTSEAET